VLAVDEDTFASGRGPVLETHSRVAPRDQISDRIALIQRVQEVANLDRLPDESLWISGMAISPDFTQVSNVSMGCGVTE
jgi:hypothetical protein